MQEKKIGYHEGLASTVTHNGETFFVDLLLHLAKSKPMQDCLISRLSWILDQNNEPLEFERANKANTVYPLIIVKEPTMNRWGPEHRLVVLDGAHRLQKAVWNNRKKIKVRVLTLNEIREAHLEPVFESEFWKNYPY